MLAQRFSNEFLFVRTRYDHRRKLFRDSGARSLEGGVSDGPCGSGAVQLCLGGHTAEE